MAGIKQVIFSDFIPGIGDICRNSHSLFAVFGRKGEIRLERLAVI